jgi:ribosomal protein S18 acetylase RimI-like enzyme
MGSRVAGSNSALVVSPGSRRISTTRRRSLSDISLIEQHTGIQYQKIRTQKKSPWLAVSNNTSTGTTSIAQPHEYGMIADVHCRSFYPGNVSAFWELLLRLDRVLALEQGYAMSEKGFPFHCIVCRISRRTNHECITQTYEENQPTTPVVVWILRRILAKVLESKSATAQDEEDTAIAGAVCVDTNMTYIPRQRFTWPAFFNGSIFSLAPRKPMAYISNLAVCPSQRRAGIGRSLVLAAESLAVQEWGARCCTLHVDPTNTAAYQLYTRLGYRYVSRQDAWTAFLEGRRQDSRLVLLYKKLS